MSRTAVERWTLPLVVFASLLGAWWLLAPGGKGAVFPSPVKVFAGVRELAATGLLFQYSLDSLLRVFAAFLLTTVVALPLGFLLGVSERASALVGALLQLLRPISPLAWMPVVTVAFGVGMRTGVALIFLGTVFSLTLTASAAVSGVPRMYLDAGRNFGLGPAALFTRVVVPAALPQLVSGLRVAGWISWQVMVAAEMLAVSSGLGYMLVDARNAGKRYDLVVASILLIGLLGLLIDAGLKRLEQTPATAWAFREGQR